MVTLPRTPPTPSPASRSPPTPSSVFSSASTLVNSDDDVIRPTKTVDPPSKLDEVFRIHDLLVRDVETSQDFPFTNIVSLGGQSAGKSTVLSMISGVPLYSETRTATVCPIQIHSRREPGTSFSATIEIEITHHLTGAPARVAFTSSPISKGELARASRLASYQARGCQDDISQIESYEALLRRGEAWLQRYLDEEKAKRWWTPNVVILHVSGPAQSNVSIIDLPGLMGGEDGAQTRSLVEASINSRTKGHNLILVCAAGGGSDLSPDDPCFQLARRHDPNGSRTMCLITKADKIDSASSVEDLILGEDPAWDGWAPAHGWWPISAKTTDENKHRTDPRLIARREEAMFGSGDKGWLELQSKAGRKFGTLAVTAKLYAVFEDMVMTRNADDSVAKDLRRSLASQITETSSALSLLPPQETDPIGTLHQTVFDIWRELVDVMKVQSDFTKRLHDTQRDLTNGLAATVPLYLPYLENDSTDHETYENPTIQGWTGDGTTIHVYMDEVLDVVRRRTSDRTQVFDLARVRHDAIKKYASDWSKVCEDHVETVWKHVLAAIAQVLDSVCGDKPDLRARISELLDGRHEIFKADTMARVQHHCRRELYDPAEVDMLDQQVRIDYSVAFAHFDAYHSAQYHVPLVRAPAFSGASQPAENAQTVSNADTTDREEPPRADSPNAFATAEERKRCFFIMASVTAWLVRGLTRTSNEIGREAQAQAMDFLKDVMPTLRKGLGLEQVVKDVFVRSGKMLEPDVGVVKRREVLGKRKRELEEMNAAFKSIYADF